MRATVRPEVSKANKYWVEKRRYYELKYFCLQYPLWKKGYELLDGMDRRGYDPSGITAKNGPSDPTGKTVEKRLTYFDWMEMIEQTAINTDPDLASYILKAVTEGLSYTHLKAKLGIPCGKDMYYDRYRRFFWLLNQVRN